MRPILITIIVLALLAPVAGAQSNLGVTGGMLLPFGDLGDIADASPYVGARYEIQDVNALGQVAVMTFLVHGGFAFLQTDSDLEELLDEAGDTSDGSYFDAGLGMRVYSAASPLFVGAGLGYANLDPAGSGDSVNGFLAHAGAGLVVDLPSIKVDLEGRVNFVAGEDDNYQHFQVLLTLGLPFE